MIFKKCTDCIEYKNCKDSFGAWFFFIIGIIATVAVRVVTVLIHMNPIYAKIAWYIGISGFFLFFIYKFKVSQNRTKLIRGHDLVRKVNAQKNLERDDYALISAILCGLSSKKERVNYFVIFGLSAIALLLAIYMDFIK